MFIFGPRTDSTSSLRFYSYRTVGSAILTLNGVLIVYLMTRIGCLAGPMAWTRQGYT